MQHEATWENESSERSADPPSPDEIIASVAHDLRTPLTALLQALDIVVGGRVGPVAESQQRFLRIGLKSARDLLELVDGLQERSLIRTGRLRVRFQPVDPVEIARSVIEVMGPLAESRSIHLALEECGAMPPVWADPVLVRRALVNLVGNAVKFTPEGGRVDVAVEVADDGTRIIHSIRDTGPGIPPAERNKIFERHHRTRHAAARPGCGLGLSIVRDIVQAHAGRVAVAGNGPSRGSTFLAAWPALGSGLAAESQLAAALARVDDDHHRHQRLVVLAAGASLSVADFHDRVHAFAPSEAEVIDIGGGGVGVLIPGACAGDAGTSPKSVEPLAFAGDLAECVRTSLCTASAEPSTLIAAARSALGDSVKPRAVPTEAAVSARPA